MSEMNMALARQAAQERQAINARRAEVLRMQRDRDAEAGGSPASPTEAVTRGVFARVAERLHLVHAHPAMR